MARINPFILQPGQTISDPNWINAYVNAPKSAGGVGGAGALQSYNVQQKYKQDEASIRGMSYASSTLKGADLFTGVMAGLQGYNNLSFKKKQAELEGRQAIIQGEQQANAILDQLDETVSTAKAVYASRGVARGSGTPRNLMELSMERGGEDIQQIKRTAEKKKRAKDYEARQLGIAKKGALWNLAFQTSAKAGKMLLKAKTGGAI